MNWHTSEDAHEASHIESKNKINFKSPSKIQTFTRPKTKKHKQPHIEFNTNLKTHTITNNSVPQTDRFTKKYIIKKIYYFKLKYTEIYIYGNTTTPHIRGRRPEFSQWHRTTPCTCVRSLKACVQAHVQLCAAISSYWFSGKAPSPRTPAAPRGGRKPRGKRGAGFPFNYQRKLCVTRHRHGENWI